MGIFIFQLEELASTNAFLQLYDVHLKQILYMSLIYVCIDSRLNVFLFSYLEQNKSFHSF